MKLIKIKEDHYVVVDDSEIKEGDWYLIGRTIYHCLKNIPKDLHNENKIFKITHSTQPLEEKQQAPTYTDNAVFINFNSQKVYDKVKQLSLQEVKELIGETDKPVYHNMTLEQMSHSGHYDFVKGYNQALEDNKEKKYTEEDMINAFREGTNAGALHERLCDYDNGDYEDAEQYSEQYEESFIKSLQPKTEWEVEVVDGKLKLK